MQVGRCGRGKPAATTDRCSKREMSLQELAAYPSEFWGATGCAVLMQLSIIGVVAMKRAVNNYHLKLLKIWGQHQSTGAPGLSLAPYLGQLPNPGNEVDVLFIGLNPSYIDHVLRRHLQDLSSPCPGLTKLGLPAALQWHPILTPGNLTQIIALDNYSRNNHPRFYKVIESVAVDAQVGTNWHHIDLFPIRESKQDLLAKYLEKNKVTTSGVTFIKRGGHNLSQLPPPFQELFNATMTLVCAMKPSVVVVVNSLASRLIESCLPLTRQSNGHRYEAPTYSISGTAGSHPDEAGCLSDEAGILPDEACSLCGVPFLLSSQLSGGATSTYGRERLVADLRDAFRGGTGLK